MKSIVSVIIIIREPGKRKGTGNTQDFAHAEEKEVEKHSIFNHARERELEKHGIFNHIRERELEKQHFQLHPGKGIGNTFSITPKQGSWKSTAVAITSKERKWKKAGTEPAKRA